MAHNKRLERLEAQFTALGKLFRTYTARRRVEALPPVMRKKAITSRRQYERYVQSEIERNHTMAKMCKELAGICRMLREKEAG